MTNTKPQPAAKTGKPVLSGGIHDGDDMDEAAFKALIRAGVAANKA